MAEPNTSSTTARDGGIVNRVKSSATAQLTTQKDRGVDALGNVARAVRSGTKQLRDDQHDMIANYVDKAADQVEMWSRRLKEKNVSELLADVQRLARRQPAVFIASAFALGVVGARFVKSSRPQHESSSGSSARIGRNQGRRIESGTAANSDVEPTDAASTGRRARSTRTRTSNARTETT